MKKTILFLATFLLAVVFCVDTHASCCNAGFSYQALGGNSYQFTMDAAPDSASGQSIEWYIGGSYYYNETSLVHHFAYQGVYDVYLIVERYSLDGQDTVYSECSTSRKIVIRQDSIFSTPCIAGFSYALVNGLATFTTDQPDALVEFWSFGDGQYSMGGQTTQHTYTAPGYYSVCQYVNNYNPLDSLTTYDTCMVCHQIWIAPEDTIGNPTDSSQTPSCKAGFSYSSQGSLVTFSTNHSDASVNLWSFGDGTYSYGNQIVQHSYASAGSYLVCQYVDLHNAQDSSIYDTCMVCQQIWIAPQDTIVPPLDSNKCRIANFNYHISGNTVYLNSDSTALGKSQGWFFHNGDYSDQENTSYTYSQPGVYSICHVVRFNPNALGYLMDSCMVCEDININVTNSLSLTIYPNPVDDLTSFSFSDLRELKTVKIITFYGATVKMLTNLNSHSETIDVSDLWSGVYYAEVEATDGTILRKKMIIN